MNEQGNKTLFICLAIVAGIIVIGILFLIIRSFLNKKHFAGAYYKKIYRIAVLNDYYLINRYVGDNDGQIFKIDHILFGEKFIYVISSKYYAGDLTGKYEDKSLVFVAKNGKTFYTENPIFDSKSLVTNLSCVSGVSPDYFIGITLVNDDCNIGVETPSKQFYIMQRDKLPKLIKAIESRNVGKLNGKKVHEAVLKIDASNQKKKKNNEK